MVTHWTHKKNVDHLFQFPVSSASKAEKTADDHFLPDLFVLEPSTTLVHKFLKTPAGGASVADFLQQHFFTSWDHPLPLRLGEVRLNGKKMELLGIAN